MNRNAAIQVSMAVGATTRGPTRASPPNGHARQPA